MPRLHLTIKSSQSRPPRRVLVEQFPFYLGRALENDLPLPYPSLSGRHIAIDCSADGIIRVTDQGSTNGTHLGNQALLSNQPHPIDLPARLRLGDVHVEIDTAESTGPSFTMAQSSTRLHEMVDNAVRASSDGETRPFFEILSGPGGGRRFFIEPDGPDVVIGTDDAADVVLELPDLGSPLATLTWDDSAGWLVADDDVVRYGGAPIHQRHRLKSGDRFVIAALELLYFDPLEEDLQELTPGRAHTAPTQRGTAVEVEADDDCISSPVGEDSETAELPVEPEGAQQTSENLPLPDAMQEPAKPEAPSSRRLGLIELALLAMSVVFLFGTVALLYLFFG